MSEKTCLECGKVVDQVEGRRPRLFCKDTNCKASYHKRKNPKVVEKLPKGVKAITAIVGYSFNLKKISEEDAEIFSESHPVFYKSVGLVDLPKDYLAIKNVKISSEVKRPIGFVKVTDLKDELKTKITYAAPSAESYDGAKISANVQDEFGQWDNRLLNGEVVAEGTIGVLPEMREQNKAIEEQIKAIKAEKVPDHRNTSLGKKVWENEQKKRIEELLKQIK